MSKKNPKPASNGFTSPPELHIMRGNGGDEVLGELFKACGWRVIYENQQMETSAGGWVFTRPIRKPKGTRRRSGNG